WANEFLRRENSAGFRPGRRSGQAGVENQRCRSCDYGGGEFGLANARRQNAGRDGAAGAKAWQEGFCNCWAQRWKSSGAPVVGSSLRTRAVEDEQRRTDEARCGVIA